MASPQSTSRAHLYQIGEVADRVGLSLRTVRYYEEKQLIVPDERTEGGFRLFDESGIKRLEMIMAMKPLGLSIAEMRELLHACDFLQSASTGPKARKKAIDDVGKFVAQANARLSRMEEQITAGRALVGELLELTGGGTSARK